MEFRLIDRIRERTAQGREDVRLGIGDDAAVVAPPAGQELAIAVDTMVEGVHFPHGTDPADIGWKVLAVNLSDLAAMGASPAWALLALTLPRQPVAQVQQFIDGFADGFTQLAQPHRLALIGGDTTSGPLSVSVAVHGFVPPGQALVRGGARAGDVVLVTGTLGDAAAGLRLLQSGARVTEDARAAYLIERLHRPTPRLQAGLALRGRATACIDVSDGLLADLGHICEASALGAELEASLLPRSPMLLGSFDDVASLNFALAGGDDYELCFTVPPSLVAEVQGDLARLGCGATRIGRMVEGAGVRVRDEQGQWLESNHRGWDHFA
ncbi:thiamine-phosphate kinase [Dyella solisilvae]|uniref:Thiamine-monophosphate kinase n=1 Tax=Dyella solisilvae TaxID=1920168 RepID=A0A370KC91_9GAMM|nr:thiamine-phosphate kinase [Dyella solisilvae]RDJ00273.1 thiamine-phosphate kinase [Dyella solisilvae]